MISVDSSQIQRDPESFPVALHHTTPSVPGPRSDPGPDACRRPSLVHSIPPVRFLLLVGEGMGMGPTQDQTQKEVHKQPPNLLGFWSAFRVVACSESIHYDLNSHLLAGTCSKDRSLALSKHQPHNALSLATSSSAASIVRKCSQHQPAGTCFSS